MKKIEVKSIINKNNPKKIMDEIAYKLNLNSNKFSIKREDNYYIIIDNVCGQ